MPLPSAARAAEPALEAWLLGRVEYGLCLDLQERLVAEAAADGGKVALLLCEHPPVLTIGRRGSHAHVLVEPRELTARQIDTRVVNHGGGCLLHLPGQLAAYPIFSLQARGWSVGCYLRRLQSAIARTLEDLRFAATVPENGFGAWGRAGQVAALGVAVKHGVAYHGVYVNVCPAMDLFRFLRTDPQGDAPMSSLFAEQPSAGRMPKVRETLVRRLAEALDCPKFLVFGGHPWLRRRS